MTTVAPTQPQSLPPAAVPGVIPGSQAPVRWTGLRFAQTQFGALPISKWVMVPANLLTTLPTSPRQATQTRMFVPVGSSLPDAVAAAAKLSFASAARTFVPPYDGRPVPASQTVALLQAADGVYYATGGEFRTGRHSMVPAVGVPAYDNMGTTLRFDFTKLADELKALVWADRWVDLTNKHVGETVSVGAA